MALLGPRCTQHLFPTKYLISRSHPSFLLLHHTAALMISPSLIPSVLATPVMKSHGAGEVILFWRRSVPHGEVVLVAVAPMLGSSGRQAMEPETHDLAATWRHWRTLKWPFVLLPPTKKWRLFGFKSFQGHNKTMIHNWQDKFDKTPRILWASCFLLLPKPKPCRWFVTNVENISHFDIPMLGLSLTSFQDTEKSSHAMIHFCSQ